MCTRESIEGECGLYMIGARTTILKMWKKED